MSHVDPVHVQMLAAILFAIGLAVAVSRRNLFFLLMGIELMLNAVNLSFIGFARTHVEVGAVGGHLVPLFVIAIAAAEACVGLAMVMCIVRNRDSIDGDAYADLKE